MSKIFFNAVFIFFIFSSTAFASSSQCFKIGEYWHDLKLPNDMKNVRWLFGDDKSHYPFMSVSFDLSDQQFEVWAKDCEVQMQIRGKRKFWDKDLESGGFLSVMKYENQRYCIGIIRTPIPEEKRYVDGEEYYGCPLDDQIEY